MGDILFSWHNRAMRYGLPRSIPQTSRKLLNADSKAMYAPPGYLLFVRGETLMAQLFDANRGELGRDPIAIAEDVPVNAANGRAAFSVSESGILSYRAGNAAGVSRLVWFDRKGKELSVVGEPARYSDLSLSPDGTAVWCPHSPMTAAGSLDIRL